VGYTKLVSDLVHAAYPDRDIIFINAGAGGSRSVDLQARLETDVLGKQPTWVTISAGVNDVARFVTNPAEAVTLKEFQSAITDMVSRLQTAGVQVGLLTTTVFEHTWRSAEEAQWVNELLVPYNMWLEEYAAEQALLLVPMWQAFNEALAEGRARDPNFSLTADGVHLNDVGRSLMALTWLRAFGFVW